jgi:hypothetical protein
VAYERRRFGCHNGVTLAFIDPGPFDVLRVRAGAERLRRVVQWLRSRERSSFRDECLNEELSSIPAGWFLDLEDAKAIIEAWRTGYNPVS